MDSVERSIFAVSDRSSGPFENLVSRGRLCCLLLGRVDGWLVGWLVELFNL